MKLREGKTLIVLIVPFLLLVAECVSAVSAEFQPFVIRITEQDSGKPVPLIELELENRARFISDNQGIISIIAPDLNGRTVRFLVEGHGYNIGKTDFWGQESISCQIKPGKTFSLKIKRKQLAQRLYRITGAGRYNHSILAGLTKGIPVKNLLPGNVIGQDSLIAIPWKDKLWCFYGDTLGLNSYNFSASCATLPLKNKSYDPEKFLPLKYKVDNNGFARPMIKTGKSGFTWIEYVLPVKIGFKRPQSEALLAKYVQHETLDKVIESGFAVMTQNSKNFKIVKRMNSTRHHRCKHPFPVRVGSESFFLLSPSEMVRTNLKNIVNQQKQKRLSEALFAPIEIDSGKRIKNFNGSIVYNKFIKSWIAINQGAKPGQIIFSTADTPSGPWGFAKTVTEFNDYNLYNPVIHPWFKIDQGRSILFEGTYTWFFSGSEEKTPWADYNQVMFKLDLTQPQLKMPRPVYLITNQNNDKELACSEELYQKDIWNKVEDIAFFAFPHSSSKDLVNLSKIKGEGFNFSVLKSEAVTNWGKSWFKPEIAKYLRYLAFKDKNSQEFGLFKEKPAENEYKTVGIVLYISDIAKTWSPQIKAGNWNDWRKQ
ncbi:MAG: hypothetical protein ACQETH_08875 [Candidatus Rifleibacteriota bacterium]